MSARKQNLSLEFQAFLVRVRSLDLGPIAYLLTRSNSGPQWTKQQAVKAITRYLAFLYLIDCYPHLQLVPTQEIDQVWHYHILDTRKYAEDCQILFGCFIHHFPYLGTRGEGDQRNLQRSYTLTQALFRKHFGVELAIESGHSNASAADCEPLRTVSASRLNGIYLREVSQQRPRVDLKLREALELFSIELANADKN